MTYKKIKSGKYQLHYKPILNEEAVADVVVIHGMGEHSGRYESIAQYLNERYFNVHLFDFPGHGLTESKRGHINSYSELLDAVDSIVAECKMDKKFILCHSMGGNVGLNYLVERAENKIVAASVGSPWVTLAFKPSFFMALLAEIGNKLFPSFIQETKLKANLISRLPEEVEAYLSDELIHDYISPRFFTEVQKRGLLLFNTIKGLKIPTLLYHGNEDQVTSFSSSKRLSKLNDNIRFKEWPGCYHEVHNEPVRDDLYANIYEFYSEFLV